MSDRSAGGFHILPKDQERAKEIINPTYTDDDTVGDDAPTIHMSFDESTGGGFDEAERLREAKIAYWWGWDGHSGAYDAGQQVFIPGVGSAEADVDGPTAKVNDAGEVDVLTLAEARKFLQIRNTFIALARVLGTVAD